MKLNWSNNKQSILFAISYEKIKGEYIRIRSNTNIKRKREKRAAINPIYGNRTLKIVREMKAQEEEDVRD